MTIKASAGSAMFLAAGLLLAVAGPAPALAAGADNTSVSKEDATSGKSARQGSRYLKKRYAHRKSARAAAKSPEAGKAEEKQVAEAAGAIPHPMPEWLANANAQMAATDAPPDSAKGMSAAMSEKANTVLQTAADKPAETEAPAVAAGAATSDQPGETDRGLQDATSTQMTATPGATTQGVVLASTSRAASSEAINDSSTLDKTSLIGKIFIAFGALLTVASAARMFMA